MKFLQGLQKTFLILSGSAFLFLGLLGVALPLLPTTPFLLLSAACYVRSSQRLFKCLESKPFYQKSVGTFIRKKGMTLRSKLCILIPVLILLTIMFFTVDSLFLKGLAVFLGMAKTLVFLKIRTLAAQPEQEQEV